MVYNTRAAEKNSQIFFLRNIKLLLFEARDRISQRGQKMDKHRAIPEGYMKVGELAKIANITVRTLQYYDKEGLFSPSALSEGGFRLYSGEDIAKLARVLLLKQLGFGLAEIKKRLSSLETPQGIVSTLSEHAKEVRVKIEELTETLRITEQMKREVSQMDSADYMKLFAILVNLQIKNEHYWMVKHFDDETLEFFKSNGMTKEAAATFNSNLNRLFTEAVDLHKEGISPEGEIGQSFAKEFWELMLEISGGNFELLQKLGSIANDPEKHKSEHVETALKFIDPAVELYTKTLYGGKEFQ